MSRDEACRQRILARRARFVSSALAALAGCGPTAAAQPRSEAAAPPAAHSGVVVSIDDGGPSAFAASAAAPMAPASAASSSAPVASASATVLPPPTRKPVVLVCLSIIIPPKAKFDPRATRVLQAHHQLLDETAQVMKSHPHVRVWIEGHTDDREDRYGRRFGLRRAEAVRDYLVHAGVDPSRLCPIGFGDTRPISPNSSAKSRADNRRVEFRLLEKNQSCKKKP